MTTSMAFKTTQRPGQALPFLDLNVQYAGIREEVEEAIMHVMESQHFILGPKVEALEKEIAQFTGCVHAVEWASGSDALILTLMALEIGRGDGFIAGTRHGHFNPGIVTSPSRAAASAS